MFTITWNDHEKRVESLRDLDQLLDELHLLFGHEDPTLATVEVDKTGDSLSIGLGRDLSVLSYVRGDKAPPYYVSAGGADIDEAISFRFGGEWSEFPIRSGISILSAREAIRDFCKTGELTDQIDWEEV